MKKQLLHGSMAILLSLSAAQGMVINESFDYPIAGNLVGSGGDGWNSGWGTFPIGGGLNRGVGGVGNISAVQVQAQSIGAPSDYALPRSGGEAVGVVGYPSAWREFAPANRISTTAQGTTYFSFLFKMDAVGAGLGGSYLLLDLLGADRTDLFRVGVGVGLDTAAILDGSNGVLDTGRTITGGTSYLFVGKLDTDIGLDTLSATVFAADELIGAEPSLWEMTASQDLDAYFEIDRIGLLFGGMDGDPSVAHTGRLDELRFGDSFEAVTGVPEPSIYAALFGAAALGCILLRRKTSNPAK